MQNMDDVHYNLMKQSERKPKMFNTKMNSQCICKNPKPNKPHDDGCARNYILNNPVANTKSKHTAIPRLSECIECSGALISQRCINPNCELYSIYEYVKKLEDNHEALKEALKQSLYYLESIDTVELLRDCSTKETITQAKQALERCEK